MSVVDRFPLEADEMEPLADWFRITLRNVERLRSQQNHNAANALFDGAAYAFDCMREHGKQHGYSVDLLFPDVRDGLANEAR